MTNFFAARTCAALVFLSIQSYGQVTSNVDLIGRDESRPINTAVPFLTISTDARSGALGEVGAAITPDANASYWNVSRLAFIDQKVGGAISYTPWLRKLVNDMSISYLTGYYKPTREQAFAFSLKYFNLGELQFTDAQGGLLNDFRPKEYAPTLSYARLLSNNFSVGVSGKFIYSNLSGSLAVSTQTQTKPGISGAVDFGIFYTKELNMGTKTSQLSLGASITDIGGKLSYTNSSERNFLPSNLRLGTAYTTELDPFNKITFAVDLNKLLVPTSPVYARDTANNFVLVRGRNPNDIPLLQGIFGSFSDAPDGFKEELREINISGAIEYWYNDLFAARGGVFLENKLKGNRKYMTLGFGVKYQGFGLDFAYLVPFVQNNPLSETLRFTLSFNFEGKLQESVTE